MIFLVGVANCTSENADWFTQYVPIMCIWRAGDILFQCELMAKYEIFFEW